MPKIKQFSLATTHRPNPAAVQSLEIPAIKFQVQRRPVMPSLQDRVAQWLLSDDKEMDASPPRPKPSSEKMLMAWRRMVLHSIRICGHPHAVCGRLPGEQEPRHDRHQCSSDSRQHSKARRTTRPRPRCVEELGDHCLAQRPQKNGSSSHRPVCAAKTCCASEGRKNNFWWTCLGCGSRWQRLEWEMDQQENTKGRAGSSTDQAKSPQKTADKLKCGLSGPAASTSIPSTVMCESRKSLADGGDGGQVSNDSSRPDDPRAHHPQQDQARGRSTTGTASPESCQGEGKPQEDVSRSHSCTAPKPCQSV